MVHVGVIGCGYWGPNLVRVFHECVGARVVAACDRQPAPLEEVRNRYPTVRGFLDPRELIADDEVRLVVIATPLASHFDLARLAITHGKHVLVEKPIAQTSAEAEELVDLAARQGVLLAVDHTFLFTPAVQRMKELIDGRQLGHLTYVDSVRINLGLIQEEMNVIWDLAPHDLSILDYLTERMPRRVVATGGCHTVSGQVDVAYINLDYGDGLIANFHVNWLSPVKVRRMMIGGDRRMIIYDELSSNEKVRIYDSGAMLIEEGCDSNGKRLRRLDYRVGDIWTPHLPQQEALAVEAEHLVSAIERGIPLRADGRAGLRVVRILEACEQSLKGDGERVFLREAAATVVTKTLSKECVGRHARPLPLRQQRVPMSSREPVVLAEGSDDE